MKELLNKLSFGVTTYHFNGVRTKDAIIRKSKVWELLQASNCKTIDEFVEKFKETYPEISQFTLKIID